MKSEHRSEPQNPMISSVLYKRKLLENWGRGISLMIEECKKANLPEPEFKVNGNFVVVTFHYGSQNPTSTPQVVFLIQIIQEGTYSVKEMMSMLQLKDRENFLNNYLNPAMQAGMVEPLYPDQPKHPQQVNDKRSTTTS